MPSVSVIIINYNGRQFVIDCLMKSERQSFKDFEVVIVDNGSSDGSVFEIQRFLKKNPIALRVELIPLKKNLGFAGSSLVGLRHTNGEYVALLNNDTEPDERWLEELVTAMGSNPNFGICTSKLIAHGTNLIDSAGDGISTALRGFKRGEGEKAYLYDKREYVFGACAGAALFRRKMIEEIGFLDEDFFLIHEDTDLNLRAQLHGWKVMYVPTAVVYHRVRSSIGQMSNMAVYYTLRNSELVRFKNVPLGVFISCFPEFLMGALTEFIYFAIKHGRLRLYLKAKMDAVRMLPKMLKKREGILKDRKVTNRYLLNIMTSAWQIDFLMTKIKKFLYA